MSVPSDRRAAFESLVADHVAAVRAYVRRRAPAGSDDDVVAETFLVAWRRLEEIGEDPLPWLLGVARRVLANQHRSERRRHALSSRLTGLTPAAMPAFEAPEAMGDRLAAALGELSPAQREALLLVAWEGLEPSRAARAAGCTPAAFRVRLHRARARLAARLDEGAGRGPSPTLHEEPR